MTESVSPSHSSPLFRFGLISDIQYGDFEDGMNFSKTENRWFRASRQHARSAVDFWNQQNPQPHFILQLGDFIDGQSSGTYGQGLALDQPVSQKAFNELFEEFSSLQMPIYHCIGNHELYNFNYTQLKTLLSLPSEDAYYHFSPHPQWRVIILNPYRISEMCEPDSFGYQEAIRILSENNPNYAPNANGVNFFTGLEGVNQRFVPFNGGFGQSQLNWLAEVLDQAVQKDEKIIVASHLPLNEKAANPQNLAFDYDDALQILHTHGQGCIVSYFAGHRHSGGYAQDHMGIHHLTIQSPLTHGLCFASADVYSNRLEIQGQGKHRSYTFHF